MQSLWFCLQIAEVVLGVACMILGAIVTGIIGEEISSFRSFLTNYRRGSNSYRYGGSSNNFRYIDSDYLRYGTVDYRYDSLFTIGEGIWCGIWVRIFLWLVDVVILNLH